MGELSQDEFVGQVLTFPAHAITAALRQISPKGSAPKDLKGAAARQFQDRYSGALEPQIFVRTRSQSSSPFEDRSWLSKLSEMPDASL